MTDVPDQAIVRRIEYGMDRNGQLDHAQRRAEMAARHRYRTDRFGTQLIGHRAEVGVRQTPECLGLIDLVEKGRGNGHDNLMDGRSWYCSFRAV